MKFYGQSKKPHSPLDKVLYERYFKNFVGKGICLECGAVDGVTISSTKFFEETLGWKAINIEPHPESFQKLLINRPKSININVALSDVEEDSYLVTRKNFYLRAYVVKDSGKDRVLISKGIYRNIIDKLDIDHIDLMVLDVEGHEKEALNGMIGAKILPKILCVEFNHVGKDAIKGIVSKMGYKYDSSAFINDIYKKE